MRNKQRVGLRIRALRLTQGYTQDQFAEKLDRSIETISNIERGKSYPSFETLERLSETFEIPVKAFFEFEEDNRSISKKRALLLEDIRSTTIKLSDKQLQIAVKQLKALIE